jgi:hypothetical protein
MLVICPTTKAKYFFRKGWTVFAKQLAGKSLCHSGSRVAAVGNPFIKATSWGMDFGPAPFAQNSFAILPLRRIPE